MPNLIAASRTISQPLYDFPPEDDVDAVSSQWGDSTDSGMRSAGSLESVKVRTTASSEPRHPPMPKQRVSINGPIPFAAPAGPGSADYQRAMRHDKVHLTTFLGPLNPAPVPERSPASYPPKNNPFAIKGNNPFDGEDDEFPMGMAPPPQRADRTPTPASVPASAISSADSSSEAPSATLKMLQQLRTQGSQKVRESRRAAETSIGSITAAVSGKASLRDPLDGMRDKWTKLHGALNKNQPPGVPQDDTTSAMDTPIARHCSAFYDSLMRHAQQGSALSFHQVAKALRVLTLDAGAVDHTQFRDTLRYTTLQPHLGSARIEHLFRLARLRNPRDRSRAEMISTAGRLLTASLAKNKVAAKAAVPLADALLDAVGTECHRAIQQRWINNVELAIAANKALKAAPLDNRERETARLVEALRELAIIGQQVDFDMSSRQRLRDLHTGLSKSQAKELDDMLGIGQDKFGHADAKHFHRFLNGTLPGYETDAGMQARMATFIEQWRDAREENPMPGRRELDYSTMRKSVYHRSWAPVRFFSRLRQILTGKAKEEPIRTRNEIKDLVAALTTGKPLRRELKGIDHLDRIFQATPPDAPPELAAEKAEFKKYLQHTLRKLEPQEARALHASLVQARQDLQSMGSSELRALGWTEALYPELERALEREFHVRELVKCVTDANSALQMSRRNAARQHNRGEALIAAMDKLAKTMATAPEAAQKIAQESACNGEQEEGAQENAFDLLTEAVARTVDFDGVRSNDRRVVGQAVEDMDAVLGYKCPQWGQARTGTLHALAHAGYLATR